MTTVMVNYEGLVNSNESMDKNTNSTDEIRTGHCSKKSCDLNTGAASNMITDSTTTKEPKDTDSEQKSNNTSNSIIQHEEFIMNYKVKNPRKQVKDRIIPLEKELFSLLNMEYGKDLIYEDLLIANDFDRTNNDYYIHLLRSGNLDPNKENFLLIHGFLSSSIHFLAIFPYLLKKYNVFIPDTIGMGLSARPQINFHSPAECENYFVEVVYIIVKKLFFNGKYNIKKEFFIGGHSLGGFIVSRYVLRYPKGIKKVLFLSAAGITDYRIKNTNILKEAGKLLGCIFTLIGCCWTCQPRMQCFYKCFCCKPFVKKVMGRYYIKIDYDNIKPNEDGSPFIVDTHKIRKIMGRLSKITLDFPDDIYKCVFYCFTSPPPAAVNPVELKLLTESKLKCCFVFGENDWMDRDGAYRLCQRDRNRFKMFIINNAGHSFAMENPKGLENILDCYF